MFDIEPYYRQGPLAEVDHQLPATWTAYLSMRQEIRESQVHHQLQRSGGAPMEAQGRRRARHVMKYVIKNI